MSTNSDQTTFFAPLSTILSVEDLPDELGFIKEGMTDVLDSIYYRDLEYAKSPTGDKATYSMVIIRQDEISVEIPGTGMSLIINPNLSLDTVTEITEIPVTLSYHWPVIAYLHDFSPANFAGNPAAFFDLVLRILDYDDFALVDATQKKLVSGEDSANRFIDAVNSVYGIDLAYPVSQNDPVGEILLSMKSYPELENIAKTVFTVFLLETVNVAEIFRKMNRLFSEQIPNDLESFVKDLITPKIEASLDMAVGLEFSRSVLRPLDDGDGSNDGSNNTYVHTDPPMSRLIFSQDTDSRPTFAFSTEKGIGYHTELNASLVPDSQIGNTGLTISVVKAKLDLSRTENLREADLDGRPPDFIGVYLTEVTLGLPNNWKEKAGDSTALLFGKNLLLGTGGISGSIGLKAKSPDSTEKPIIKAGLGNFEIGLDTFDLTFKQNSIISSRIRGYLSIPGLKNEDNNDSPDARVNIDAYLGNHGDYSITASSQQEIGAIYLPGAFKMVIKSLFLGNNDQRFFVGLSGMIDIISNDDTLKKVMPKNIEIKKLMIWDDGTIELEGGGITLPKAVIMEIGPVKFSVTAIHYGSCQLKERQYCYFGFDGGLSVNPGGVDARGDGIKYYFTVDAGPFHSFLQIDGIGIKLTIPGDAAPETATLILEGYLAMRSPEESEPLSKEYSGAVSVALPKLKLAGSAAMSLNPGIPSFIVDLGLKLSVPITLGATGLGIYGFRGLLGMKYIPDKAAADLVEEDPWWKYYKSKKSNPLGKEGIYIEKFSLRDEDDVFSIGAGVSLATTFDSGCTFSSKLFFLLGLPDVFLLQGQGNILSKRIGLDDADDPPFFALISISDTSIESAFGVDYKVPQTGEFKGSILSLSGLLESAYFWGDASSWHMNVGKDQPEEKRIRAKILTLFNGYAYLMLSSAGIKTGAGASFQLEKSYGPVGIKFGLFLDTAGQISYKPLQIGGFVIAGGYADIRVFGFSLGFDITVGLLAELPKPFLIIGFLRIKFRLRLFWFLKISFSIQVELKWEKEKDLDTKALPIIAEANLLPLNKPAVAYNILSKETIEVGHLVLDQNEDPPGLDDFTEIPIIPLDCFIDVEFLQSVKPAENQYLKKIGGLEQQAAQHYLISVPPTKENEENTYRKVTHELHVDLVRVLHWNPEADTESNWLDYDIYEAVSPIKNMADLPDVSIYDQDGVVMTDVTISDLSKLKSGYWQYTSPNRFNKLRILSQNMFSFQTGNSGGKASVSSLGYNEWSIFCLPEENEICVTWQPDEVGIVYPPNKSHSINNVSFTIHETVGTIVELPENASIKRVGLKIDERLDIRFPVEIARTRIRLFSQVHRIFVAYFKREICHIDGVKSESKKLLQLESYTPDSLQQEIIYDQPEKPIDLIEIVPFSFGHFNTNNLWLGKSLLDENRFFQGWLDEVKLFNQKLSEDEIYQIMKFSDNYPEPLASWHLNNDTKDTVSSHHGRSYNAVPSEEGVFDQAYAFAGDAYIEVPHHPHLNFAGDEFSIVFWVKPLNTSDQHTIIDKRTAVPSGSLFGYHVYLTENCLNIDLAAGEESHYQSAMDLVLNQWHFIAVTVDFNSSRLQTYYRAALRHEFELDIPQQKTCPFVLQKLCYLTKADTFTAEGNSEESYKQAGEVMIASINDRFQPIWRPDTKYVIQIMTVDKITFQDEGVSQEKTEIKNHYFAFQTAGPIGHFHEQDPRYLDLVEKNRLDAYKWANLQHYIDFEHSYPNAKGKLINAKPLFYDSPDFRLVFKRDYVYAMFSDWEEYQGMNKIQCTLQAKVYDPEGSETISKPTWELCRHECEFEDHKTLNDLILYGHNCIHVDHIHSYKLVVRYKVPELKPSTGYTVQFVSHYKKNESELAQDAVVHRFSFQTSRYLNFKEQINSCQLDQNLKMVTAIYEQFIDVSGGMLSLAQSIVNQNMNKKHPLVSAFGDRFDRLMNGALKMQVIDPPGSTEFNLLIEPNNKRLIGILIRNPEPFNNPKIPLQILEKESIKVFNNLADDETANLNEMESDYMSVISNDATKIFITNQEMQITEKDLTFYFAYFIYDGKEFVVAEEVLVKPIFSF